MDECYPPNWRHATIHLNPDTGEMHSDGDHFVRMWIQERIGPSKGKGKMSEKWEKAFNSVVFAVTRLVFGDQAATSPVHLHIIRLALQKLGVDEIIKDLVMS